MIARGAAPADIGRLAMENGMRGLHAAALARAERGETTLAEVERVIGAAAAPKGRLTEAARAVVEPAILVVDDDPVQRLLMTSVLAKNGYQTIQETNGANALKRIASGEECALLLTDLQMPEMDGEALVRALRANARTAALPIIVVTGTDDEARESQLIDLGADDYLRKPVDATRLVARVKAALRRAAT